MNQVINFFQKVFGMNHEACRACRQQRLNCATERMERAVNDAERMKELAAQSAQVQQQTSVVLTNTIRP